MAGMRMSTRKIREVLRLTHELGLSVREVREATGVGKTAVCEYVNRAKVLGITWPIPPEIGDAELERLLFTPAGFHEGSTKTLPDWAKVHEELKRRGVTLMILWETDHTGHVTDPARQHPRPWLLPLSHSRMIACPGRPASGGTRRQRAGETKTKE